MKQWLMCIVIASTILNAGKPFNGFRPDHKSQGVRFQEILSKIKKRGLPYTHTDQYNHLLDELKQYNADITKLIEYPYVQELIDIKELVEIRTIYQKGILLFTHLRTTDNTVTDVRQSNDPSGQ